MNTPIVRSRPYAAQGDLVTRVDTAPTVASYVDAFGPLPPWSELPWWPPDVFCLCNLLLDYTEAYRFAVAPPAGHRWPPTPDWNAEVREAASAWRRSVTEREAPEGDRAVLPALVRHHWDVLTGARDLLTRDLASGEAWEACVAALTLHAVADEACAVLAARGQAGLGDAVGAHAWPMLTNAGTLSRVSPDRVRVVPKTNFATRGITIRSLSRYLALFYESVDVRWRRVDSEVRALADSADVRKYEVLLVPWPSTIRATDFHPVTNPLGNMDPAVFGFFEFAPEQELDRATATRLVQEAARQAGRVDAVILPEGAVRPQEVAMLEEVLTEAGARFLVAGVRVPPTDGSFGRNYLHFGVRAEAGWQRYEQDKHHRWALDDGQIRQYHLSRALDPHKLWWEAIDIRSRALHVIDVGGGATAAPLVCEDLARMDEVTDLLRRVGPSIVLAVLLDGPQLATRWPCRYATVLADEPGSAVLTLTSAGMVGRSRPPGMPPSRVIALWDDSVHGVREISLGRGADAVLLTTTVQDKTVWTADGRRHDGVPNLVLTGVRQVSSGQRRRRPASGTSRTAASTSSSASSE